ncbi:MAG: hypothetical protein CMN63_08510 [Sphingobium sp.]|nr:hypothetical protein [Sphingobium sp.]|tara:strand:+ start:196 stop:378 length:183 start_codon:yes stop_codon:yes gene_type:complete
MGLGKIARGLGKVGLLIEGVGCIVAAGRALVRSIKGDPAERRDDARQDRAPDSAGRGEGQ